MPTIDDELQLKVFKYNIIIAVCIIICFVCIAAAVFSSNAGDKAGIGFSVFGAVLSFACALGMYLGTNGERKELAYSKAQTKLYLKKIEEEKKKKI